MSMTLVPDTSKFLICDLELVMVMSGDPNSLPRVRIRFSIDNLYLIMSVPALRMNYDLSFAIYYICKHNYILSEVTALVVMRLRFRNA